MVRLPKFRPSLTVAAPSGPKARTVANLEAIRIVNDLETSGRSATDSERFELAKWSSWGAVPDIFDETKAAWEAEREALREALTDTAYDEARRTTINAHYTDPAYVRAIWSTLERLGFTDGRVLEPGSGLGTFIGMAPEGADMVGIELDTTTARISSALYPEAVIHAESFAATKYQRDTFDAVVGNVPFANVQLHDPVHNPGNFSMHNHFILKSLALTRPGGIVAVITSSFTMDAVNGAARRAMHDRADLLGAVRLPTGAHRRAAGTEALTDLLIFRVRELDQPKTDHLWESVVAKQLDGVNVKTNAYFDVNPGHVLGTESVGTGMFGGETLHVTATDLAEVPAQLEAALTEITQRAQGLGLTLTPPSAETVAQRQSAVLAPADAWDGTIFWRETAFTVVVDGHEQPFKVPASASSELRAILDLRDTTKRLLALESTTTADSTEMEQQRAELLARYERYQGKYGPLNRFRLTATGRTSDDGEAILARRIDTAIRLFRTDPFSPMVRALEVFDEADQSAVPAGILTQRQVVPRATVEGAGSPSEAVALSLDRTGRVDLPIVASLLGLAEDDARAALSSLVFTDPTSGDLVHAPEYLSGDVREKLQLALEAVTSNPDLQRNVQALRGVQPEDLGADEVEARLGAVWIDAVTHQQFLAEVLNDRSAKVENPIAGVWKVSGNRHSVRATEEWGTERRPATMIAEALMEQRALTVYDELDDGRRVLNPEASEAAREKGDALQERFSEWVWEDPERATRLLAEYNRRFNSIVLRDYSAAGEYLTFPGMAVGFAPRPHQRAAVARAIAEPTVGLFHEVGAGKTAEMVMAAMELKRMGLINKPVVNIPNHMIEQFSREWLQIYPQAKLLAVSSDDLAGDKRRLFVARVAANDWDGIIMSRGAFERIAVSGETEADYIATEISVLKAALEEMEGEGGMTVKRLERMVLAQEERHKRQLERPRDPGITFENTGIDYVIVDEGHEMKNLATASAIQDANITGSKRASDLHMKYEYLRRKHGLRVGIMATATPIANSITEAYVMQRYMRPDLLRQAGLDHFDAWAATFGKTVTQMEMAPTGGSSFRVKTRFAKFQNVPEMLRMWRVFADVKTADDLNLPTPELLQREDGRRLPVNVLIKPTPELEEYITDIGRRADAVANRSVTPEEDNMLKISTDGRKAALDLRLVGLHATPGALTKLQAVAANVHKQWLAGRDLRYDDVLTREPSPTAGGLQLVFCDLGTPSQNWNAYDELRHLLRERGMDPQRIRYIHEAKSDADKGRLFAAARAGQVDVLVGSTMKMGVGTNVQARATHLHEIDCPWRPADVQQRVGRIVRQGNQNSEVGVWRYIVEGSFDAYMWQSVERKATFIAQIMRGTLDAREIEDIGDMAMSAAETKALSSGNPLLLAHSEARNDVGRLERLERAHRKSQRALDYRIADLKAKTSTWRTELEQLRDAAPRHRPTAGDAFEMTVRGERVRSRADAAAAIAGWAFRSDLRNVDVYRSPALGEVGQIGGYDIEARLTNGLQGRAVVLSLVGVPRAEVYSTPDELSSASIGLVQRLENKAAGIPATIADIEWRSEQNNAEIREAQQRQGRPFKGANELVEARTRLAQVERELAEVTDGTKPSTDPAATPLTKPAESLRGRLERMTPAVTPSAESERTAMPIRVRP